MVDSSAINDPDANLQNTSTVMIGGNPTSSLIGIIESSIKEAQEALKNQSIVAVNENLTSAAKELSVLKEKLEHIGSSILKCVESDCGVPPE